MGRKLEMKKIQDMTKCQVTYSKRRTSLIKKAHEISVFCDADVALIMFSPSGRLSKYSTPKRIEEVLTQYMNLPVHKRVRDLMMACSSLMKNRNINNIPQKMEKIWKLGHIKSDYQKLQYFDKQIENLDLQLKKSSLELQILEAGLRDYELLLGQQPSLYQLLWCERNLNNSLKKVAARKNELSNNASTSNVQRQHQCQPNPTSSLMETLMRLPSMQVNIPQPSSLGVNQVEAQMGQPANPIVSIFQNSSGVNQIESQTRQPTNPFAPIFENSSGVNQIGSQIRQPAIPVISGSNNAYGVNQIRSRVGHHQLAIPVQNDNLVPRIENPMRNPPLFSPLNQWNSSFGANVHDNLQFGDAIHYSNVRDNILGDVIRQDYVRNNLLGDAAHQSNALDRQSLFHANSIGEVIRQLNSNANVNLEFPANYSTNFNANNVYASNAFGTAIEPRTMLPTNPHIPSRNPLMANQPFANSFNQNYRATWENTFSVPFSAAPATRLSTPSLGNFGDPRVTIENNHSANGEIGACSQFPNSNLTQFAEATEDEIGQLGMDWGFSFGNDNVNGKSNEAPGINFNEARSSIDQAPIVDLTHSPKEIGQDTPPDDHLPSEDIGGNDHDELIAKLRAMGSWEWEDLLRNDFDM